jgi:hypothetical protein
MNNLNARPFTGPTPESTDVLLKSHARQEASRRLSEPPGWGKRLLFGSISTFFVMVALACLGELALRLLPLGRYSSKPFRQYDPEIGLSLIPNRHVIHSRGCFQGDVSVNRWGMRDRDRTLEKTPGEFRIAMIGDSGVEAAQVKPDEVVNIRMEKLLQDRGYKNVEVLDFAVEGIGTTQELLLYKKKVREFHPDLVLLMFTLGNDIFNNSSTLQPKIYGIHEWYSPYYDLGPDGKLTFKPVGPRHLNKLQSYLEAHSVSFYYLERMWFKVEIPMYTWEELPLYYGVYADDPLSDEWSQAWQVTGKVLAIMQDTVTADGAKFIVLAWPDSIDIDTDWQQRMIKNFGKIPTSFRPLKPEERLKGVAASNDISIDFLAPYLQAYRDQHHLSWPYFSFSCDPHFTALGHEVSARAIVQILQARNLLPTQTP